MYLRRGFHYVDDGVRNCLDIANIEAPEGKRGKGGFPMMLMIAAAEAKKVHIEYLFVESVIIESLVEFMRRQDGWVEKPGINPSFYYRIPD